MFYLRHHMNVFNKIDRASVWHVFILFTFCMLPWHQRATTWGIVLLIIHFLSDKDLVLKVKRMRFTPLAWISIAYFMYHLLGMLWTNYPSDGWKSIETKLCFLLLPILFSGENHLSKRSFRAVMPYFLISGILAFVYSLLFAFNKYGSQGIDVVFNRVNLAEGIMHPGYWSNYYAFALVFISYALWVYRVRSKWFYYLMLVSHFTIFLLLNSKTTYLFFIFFSFYLVWLALSFIENRWIRLSSIVVGSMLTFLLFSMLPPVKRRIIETLSESKAPPAAPVFAHSTESRLAAWGLEKKLIGINPIIGYGTGSANPLLLNEMKKKHYDDLVKYNMHTHNQVLHTWIDLGIPGLLLTLAFWVYAGFDFVRKQNGLGFWSAFMCFLYLFTDDALEIQAVGVFFVFLVILFQKFNIEQRR